MSCEWEEKEDTMSFEEDRKARSSYVNRGVLRSLLIKQTLNLNATIFILLRVAHLINMLSDELFGIM